MRKLKENSLFTFQNNYLMPKRSTEEHLSSGSGNAINASIADDKLVREALRALPYSEKFSTEFTESCP